MRFNKLEEVNITLLPWRISATCFLPFDIFPPQRGGLGTLLGKCIAPTLDKPVNIDAIKNLIILKEH